MPVVRRLERKNLAMRYLGGIRGAGTVRCGNEILARADYDLDGYLVKPGEVTGSGEIRVAPEALRRMFGRRDLKLQTEDGRCFGLRFSEKKLSVAGDAAHVDITDGLPAASEWRN
ncbi:MAG TPA: hypothetical protein VGM59_02680 [Dongiaceae bacterium]